MSLYITQYINEFLGAMIMIVLCNGAIANVSLNKTTMKGAGSLHCVLATGLSLLIPCCIAGNGSGTYFNSALTLALAVEGTLEWMQALSLIAAQLIGAFIGAILVYVYFLDQFDATEDPATKLNVFATSPAIPHISRNLFCEAFATFILVLAIKVIGANVEPNVQKYLVALTFTGINLSLGGAVGLAMNPARDFAPRLAHALLPIKGKGSSCWSYSLVPVLGPVIGAVCAVLLLGKLPV